MPNESTLLLLAVALRNSGITSFHGYRISTELGGRSTRSMSYSTIYRCLDRLEQLGLLSGSWDTDETEGPPRRIYEISAKGLAKAAELEDLHRAGKATWLVP